MNNISLRSIRSLYAAVRGNGDMSPSFAWYAMMASFITITLVGAVVAYNRYRWATEVTEITVPEDKSVTVSRADIEAVVAIYERKKAEYQRLMGNGQLQAPKISLGERVMTKNLETQPVIPDVSAPQKREEVPAPEFY
jgi:hypothetical protein